MWFAPLSSLPRGEACTQKSLTYGVAELCVGVGVGNREGRRPGGRKGGTGDGDDIGSGLIAKGALQFNPIIWGANAGRKNQTVNL